MDHFGDEGRKPRPWDGWGSREQPKGSEPGSTTAEQDPETASGFDWEPGGAAFRQPHLLRPLPKYTRCTAWRTCRGP